MRFLQEQQTRGQDSCTAKEERVCESCSTPAALPDTKRDTARDVRISMAYLTLNVPYLYNEDENSYCMALERSLVNLDGRKGYTRPQLARHFTGSEGHHV
jgi:hypothetical protein